MTEKAKEEKAAPAKKNKTARRKRGPRRKRGLRRNQAAKCRANMEKAAAEKATEVAQQYPTNHSAIGLVTLRGVLEMS